jgi:hypothetical protein
MTEFYYLLLDQFQFSKNNALEEILRERAHYYLRENKANDFWVIQNPQFLYEKNFIDKIKSTQFYKINKDLNKINSLYAILSSDKSFINWLGLRIGYFENLSEKPIELKGKNYSSTGLTGKLKFIDSASTLTFIPN